MSFETLLDEIKAEIDALNQRAEQIQKLVDTGVTVGSGAVVKVTRGNRPLFKFHVFSNTEMVLVEESNKWVRYLVDSMVIDIPTESDIDVEIVPIDSLPKIGKTKVEEEESTEEPAEEAKKPEKPAKPDKKPKE